MIPGREKRWEILGIRWCVSRASWGRYVELGGALVLCNKSFLTNWKHLHDRVLAGQDVRTARVRAGAPCVIGAYGAPNGARCEFDEVQEPVVKQIKSSAAPHPLLLDYFCYAALVWRVRATKRVHDPTLHPRATFGCVE